MRFPQSQQQNAEHQNLFNFLRFFFASFVLFGHCYPLVYGAGVGDRVEPLAQLTHGQTGAGSLSVGFFFALSGFLITQSWLRSPRLAIFVAKRAARILPGFYGACLFCVVAVPFVVVGSPLAIVENWRVRDVASVLLLLRLPTTTDLFRDNPVPYALNGSLWTIPLEVLCYVIVAVLGLLGLLRRRGFILSCFVLVWLAHCGATLFLPPGEAAGSALFALTQLLRLLTYFLSGAVFRLYRERIPYLRRWIWAAIAALIFGGALTGKADLILPLAGSYLLFYLSLGSRIPALITFGSRIDLSYGIYLYAFPVQQIVVAFLIPNPDPLLLFLIAWPITCLLALCSWFLAERPSLQMIGGKTWLRRALDQSILARWGDAMPKRN